MVYRDPVSFPCLLYIPSSPGTPGINTPCGIDTQPEFYFLLISSPLSLSLPHPYAPDSLHPISFFVSPSSTLLLFSLCFTLFSFSELVQNQRCRQSCCDEMRMHHSPRSTISRKWYIFKILMLNCLLRNNEREQILLTIGV